MGNFNPRQKLAINEHITAYIHSTDEGKKLTPPSPIFKTETETKPALFIYSLTCLHTHDTRKQTRTQIHTNTFTHYSETSLQGNKYAFPVFPHKQHLSLTTASQQMEESASVAVPLPSAPSDYTPAPGGARERPVLHPSLTPATFCLLLDLRHSPGCEVVSRCGLTCISLMTKDAKHLLMCL